MNTQVIMNVSPTRTKSSSEANVHVNTHNSWFDYVPGSLGWRTSHTQTIYLSLDQGALDHTASNPNLPADKQGWDYVSHLAAHEFGHVLGLMDAYDAWYQPQAPTGRATDKHIMCNQSQKDAAVTNTEIEMLLYAWGTGTMQAYSAGGLFAIESLAYPFGIFKTT